LIMIVPRSA